MFSAPFSKLNDCGFCVNWTESFNRSLENCSSTQERLLTTIPLNSLSRSDMLIRFPSVTEYMIREAKKVVKEKGVYHNPDPYCGHHIDQTSINIAQEYYLNDDLDCSRQSPNKNDVKKIVENGVEMKKVKSFMTRSIKETYQIFKENNPGVKMGISKFYTLRPKNNKCVLQECEKCPGPGVITLELLGFSEDIDENDDITYAAWEDNNLIKKTTTIKNYLKHLVECVTKTSPHLRFKEIQQKAIRNEKESCHHWKNDQVSIFTAVCYYHKDTLSYAVVTDDRNHDSAHAIIAINIIIDDIHQKYQNAITKNITIISDGAPSHFKNRYQFSEFGKSPGSRKWIFSVSGHGKRACDGVGGLLKHFATNHNLRKGPLECIQDAKTFAGIIQGYTPNVKICLLYDQKLKKFRNKKQKEWGVIIFTAIANRFRLHQLSTVEKFVMSYGGLRGAVAFALVLLIDPKIVKLQPMFMTTTIAVVYFTVFFQGITIKPLVKILNVKTAEKRKPSMNERIHERLMDHLMAAIEDILGQHGNYHIRDRLNAARVCDPIETGISLFPNTGGSLYAAALLDLVSRAAQLASGAAQVGQPCGSVWPAARLNLASRAAQFGQPRGLIWSAVRLNLAQFGQPRVSDWPAARLSLAQFVDIAQAFTPDKTSLPEKVYRSIKVKMLDWPLCVGLIIGPPVLAARIRGSAAANEQPQMS
ncbi:unnamed protein product [Brassicogethes aeneus]|uniref:Cation/H+ exchanger transmembrane domain-containing protein n=1 Tax=Brassicogethes aeneus TaxID=1431903 RepID=A0A9P0AS17_BRAAE|nr:unnamed protein product [Brassicogethes aeneus]